jgi:hypothetical protein
MGPPPACFIAGTITRTFNGVFHIIINKAGDEGGWVDAGWVFRLYWRMT